MKIVFVIGKMNGGGAERVVSVLANAFIKKNHKVAILTIVEDDLGYELDEKVRYIPNRAPQAGKLQRVAQRFSFTRHWLKRLNPDVVVALSTEINIYTLLASTGLKKPIIISERNDPYRDPPQKSTRVIRDRVYNFASGYVFQTKDARAYFNHKIQKNSVIIANPIKEDLPERYEGIRKKEIVSVARLYEQKNYPLLLRSFAAVHKKYPEYKLRIFGDGPLREELIALSKELGIEEAVVFEGFVKNVHEEIREASVFALSSDYEGISNSMLEALALGIPTVCTDCPAGGAKMFIENMENGILTKVGDEQDFTDALLFMIEHEKEADAMGSRAVAIRQKLSADTICDKWENYITKIYQASR